MIVLRKVDYALRQSNIRGSRRSHSYLLLLECGHVVRRQAWNTSAQCRACAAGACPMFAVSCDPGDDRCTCQKVRAEVNPWWVRNESP